MQNAAKKNYVMNGGPKGLPVFGKIFDAIRDPLGDLTNNALRYGDIIPINILGLKVLQLNHPDLIQYVLIENHKNYTKSQLYLRFKMAVGEGLITSNGEKWRRDRQMLQPLFKREQIEGYYFDIVNEVGEKYKRRWLKLTESGPVEIDITREMADITMEVVLRTLFGKSHLDDQTIRSLYQSFGVILKYLRTVRLHPKVDFRKLFHMPAYYEFKAALDNLHNVIQNFSQQYARGELSDKSNMLALFVEARKQNPENFTERDILDQSVSMIFGAFESTSNTMQWMWYLLDERPDVTEKLRADILSHLPSAATKETGSFSYDTVNNMHYLDAVFKETLRLYPPFWVTGRELVEDDSFGDFKVKRGTVIVLPQIIMQRHPRFWNDPNAFMPERFLGENANKIATGLYFPFSQGPRKCIGSRFAEMEAKVTVAKLLPLFKVKTLNMLGNQEDPGLSFKLKHPLRAEIQRL